MKRIFIILLSLLMFSCRQTQIPEHLPPTPLPWADKTIPTVTPNETQLPVPYTIFQFETFEIPDIPEWVQSPILRENRRLTAGQSLNIRWIQMFDESHGWAMDYDGHILNTQDGGNGWMDVTPPLGEFEPAGFFAIDSQTAWATFTLRQKSKISPHYAFVFRTTDGGTTWQESHNFSLKIDSEGWDVPTAYYQPIMMQFIDLKTGWLLVDVLTAMNSTYPLLFQSTDSGDNWNIINDHYHDLDSPVAVGFVFADEAKGWFGQNAIPLKFFNESIDVIVSRGFWETITSTDGGNTFDSVTSLPIAGEMKNPEFSGQIGDCGERRMLPITDKVIGIEWGCHVYSDTSYIFISTLSLTANGGKSWHSFPSTGNEYFLDDLQGWRLTNSGKLEKTKDGGSNWTEIKTVGWENAQFDFVNESLGLAIVSNGNESAFIRSINGGETWLEIKPIIVQ